MPRSARGAAPSRGRLFGGFALLILAALSIALPFHLHHHVDSTTNCPPQLPSDAVQAQHLLQLAQENIDRLNSLANESWADAGAASSAAAVAEPPRVAPTAAALPLATTRPAAAAASSLWLRLVLVSVARKGAPDYLVRSLRSIVESLPSSPSHPMRAATEVVAMNNNEPPDAHRVFHDAERELGNLARFVVKRPARPALDCPKAGKLRGAVQKQTCDLVATFETLLQLQPPSEMLLMLEDDWLLCPNGMLALQVSIRAAAATATSSTATSSTTSTTSTSPPPPPSRRSTPSRRRRATTRTGSHCASRTASTACWCARPTSPRSPPTSERTTREGSPTICSSSGSRASGPTRGAPPARPRPAAPRRGGPRRATGNDPPHNQTLIYPDGPPGGRQPTNRI